MAMLTKGALFPISPTFRASPESRFARYSVEPQYPERPPQYQPW